MSVIYVYIALEKPTAKELSIYIKPYAQKWYDIGILLNISVNKLDEIEEYHKNDVQSCGVRMLMEWTVNDHDACWKKLWEVVGSITKNTNTKPSTQLGNACNNNCYSLLLLVAYT